MKVLLAEIGTVLKKYNHWYQWQHEDDYVIGFLGDDRRYIQMIIFKAKDNREPAAGALVPPSRTIPADE